ncbi:hypothetical protein [Streptomyces sp. TE5632]
MAEDDAVWRLAVGHLHVRSDDGHTACSYGLAAALCDLHPEAGRDFMYRAAAARHGSPWPAPAARFLTISRPCARSGQPSADVLSFRCTVNFQR